MCPLSVGLTYRLFRKVMTFFFPQREHEYEGDAGEVDLIYRGESGFIYCYLLQNDNEDDADDDVMMMS